MKILVTGATGYIGKRLIPLLLNDGHNIVCTVRDKNRAPKNFINDENISIVEVDFLKPDTFNNIPKDIDVAYYLIHSMSNSSTEFHKLEEKCAQNFKNYIETTAVEHVIYLSGITNDTKLSKHLLSRKNVENRLASNNYALTTFKAGIIVGSGSSSFEIIRDLVEILTYKEMLLKFAEIRGLKRRIVTIPLMTPKLSSYWLYFVTSTSYKLAASLVNSMGIEIIGKPSNIYQQLKVKPISYREAVENAFVKIEQNSIVSSWKDSFISSALESDLHKHINVPTYGCFTDKKQRTIKNEKYTLEKIWSIGGKNGWYYGTFLWKFRGYFDKLFGGIGLRRGRTHPTELNNGDSLDFWRVIYANKEAKKLLLYAEMKLPGEAWLEFKIEDNILYQTATFRPQGIAGRLYWYAVTPFHWFVFNGMISRLV